MSIFLSTPSARRATRRHPQSINIQTISIHALREEGDAGCCGDLAVNVNISIHALREEGDPAWKSACFPAQRFLSTPSARRATSACWFRCTPALHFYPRPPRGGRQQQAGNEQQGAHISIHALREEGDWQKATLQREILNFYPRPPRGGRRVQQVVCSVPCPISIHALREEGDIASCLSMPSGTIFLSTPSARRATLRSCRRCPLPCYFYPRPPRGGRRFQVRRQAAPSPISIHALREEGDLSVFAGADTPYISIHALREEGDHIFGGCQAVTRYFYPRPPRGGRLMWTGSPSQCLHFYPRPPRGGRRANGNPSRAACVFLSTPSARRATSSAHVVQVG